MAITRRAAPTQHAPSALVWANPERSLQTMKGAAIPTLNRSFAEWSEIFGNPVVATALLKRLLHHASVVRIE